jgi:hypothetical protein
LRFGFGAMMRFSDALIASLMTEYACWFSAVGRFFFGFIMRCLCQNQAQKEISISK